MSKGKCTHQMIKCIRSTEFIEPFSFADIIHLFVRSFISFGRVFFSHLFLFNILASILRAFHKEAYEIPSTRALITLSEWSQRSTLSKYRRFHNDINENNSDRNGNACKSNNLLSRLHNFHSRTGFKWNKNTRQNCIFYPSAIFVDGTNVTASIIQRYSSVKQLRKRIVKSKESDTY